MLVMVRFLSFSLLLSVGAWMGLLFFSASAEAATALETVVAECKQRTGFGDSTCKTLVKKYMNVERCKEYTGYSDDECAKKIEEIKKDPEFSGGATPTTPTEKPSSPTLSRVPDILPRTSNTLAGLREKKERDIQALLQRTEAMTSFLKNKGVDTGSIEAAFPELRSRAETLLSAYDTYRAAHEGTANDTAETRKTVRTNARESVIQAMRNFVEFYQQNILTPLRVAHGKAL